MLIRIVPLLERTVHAGRLSTGLGVPVLLLGCMLGSAGSDNGLKRSHTNGERIFKLYLPLDVENHVFFSRKVTSD